MKQQLLQNNVNQPKSKTVKIGNVKPAFDGKSQKEAVSDQLRGFSKRVGELN